MDRAAALAVMIASLGLLLACGWMGQGPKREMGSDFNSISDEQLESSMGRLAAGVRKIQTLFASGKPLPQSQRSDVLQILDEMIAAADELGPEGVDSNHARMTHHLGRFREKLAIARDSVAANPPSYLLVNNIAGTCLSCHGSDLDQEE
jgi:hypothetical protein